MANPKPSFRDGDVLLRGGGADSNPIESISGGVFSHAGICGDVQKQEAVDAYPGRDPRAVAKSPLGDFFDPAHHADFRVGGIYRYAFDTGVESRAAAQYALQQTEFPYFFSLHSPILGEDGTILDDNSLYCSEFVWRCYRFGAEIQLVDPEDFFDVTVQDNADRAARIKLTNRLGGKASGAAASVPGVSKVAVNIALHSHCHNGRFITPHQLAESPRLKCVGQLP